MLGVVADNGRFGFAFFFPSFFISSLRLRAFAVKSRV
jgi:hypothetical protein